jgi:hypothetical protein
LQKLIILCYPIGNKIVEGEKLTGGIKNKVKVIPPPFSLKRGQSRMSSTQVEHITFAKT